MKEDISNSDTPDFVTKMMKEVGGVFKFGRGVLGKSAIALGVLYVPISIAAFRLHSDRAILINIGIAAVLFLVWYGYILKFGSEHPEAILLDGAEWNSFKRFEAYAKNYSPQAEDRVPTTLPGSPQPALAPGATTTDEEIE
jgi:hypothetical protein